MEKLGKEERKEEEEWGGRVQERRERRGRVRKRGNTRSKVHTPNYKYEYRYSKELFIY